MTTKIDQFKQAVAAIVARWNERVPRNHVRVVHVYRHRLIRMALEVLTVEQVLQAIDYYAGQSWQRRRNAWKKFDAFMEPTVVCAWYEEAAEDAEHKQRKAQRTDARAAALARRAAGSGVPDLTAKVKADLAAMGEAEKKELLRQAAGEMQKLIGPRRQPTPHGIERQALAILVRRRIKGQNDGNAATKTTAG